MRKKSPSEQRCCVEYCSRGIVSIYNWFCRVKYVFNLWQCFTYRGDFQWLQALMVEELFFFYNIFLVSDINLWFSPDFWIMWIYMESGPPAASLSDQPHRQEARLTYASRFRKPISVTSPNHKSPSSKINSLCNQFGNMWQKTVLWSAIGITENA